jgi:hypothetical protein
MQLDAEMGNMGRAGQHGYDLKRTTANSGANQAANGPIAEMVLRWLAQHLQHSAWCLGDYHAFLLLDSSTRQSLLTLQT